MRGRTGVREREREKETERDREIEGEQGCAEFSRNIKPRMSKVNLGEPQLTSSPVGPRYQGS